MIVTKLELKEKGKVKVYIDGEYHFSLYLKDIKTYHIEEGISISKEIYQDIVKSVLYRAKQKAMSILKYMDRTEQELKFKLKKADYSDEIIHAAIDYVKSYHYLDDERYAKNYIDYRKSSKSKRQLEMELMNKGISKRIIEQVIEEDYSGEEDAIKKVIFKKTKNNDIQSKEDKLKLANYLYNKGFSMDLIKKSLDL
jgi:regulatory protein